MAGTAQTTAPVNTDKTRSRRVLSSLSSPDDDTDDGGRWDGRGEKLEASENMDSQTKIFILECR